MKVKTSFDVGKLFSYWSHTDWVCLLEIGQILLKKLLSAVDRLNFLSPPFVVLATRLFVLSTPFSRCRAHFSLLFLSPLIYLLAFSCPSSFLRGSSPLFRVNGPTEVSRRRGKYIPPPSNQPQGNVAVKVKDVK